MIRLMMQFSACFALGMVVAGLLLIGLMFVGQFSLIEGLMLTGKPLVSLGLLLPEAFWEGLTGMPGAAGNASLHSFLQLCVALAQVALVLALGFFRLWYAR